MVDATSYPLPTPEELLPQVAVLLAASGALADRETLVIGPMVPAWSNIDFEPEFERLAWASTLDRAFMQRQVERTHREYQLMPGRLWRWVVPELDGVQLVDGSMVVSPELGDRRVLALEVPVLSLDRRRAVLRGQRMTSGWAEDFEHWLRAEGAGWTTT